MAANQYGTEWDSQVQAASEERGYDEEDKFEYVPPLRFGMQVEDLVTFVLRKAVGKPNFRMLRMLLMLRFLLPWEHTFYCLDRVLGGLARATTQDPAVRPEISKDPVAAVSFDRAIAERSILDEIYPGWELSMGKPQP